MLRTLTRFFEFLLGHDGPGADDDSTLALARMKEAGERGGAVNAKLPPRPEELGLPPECFRLVYIPRLGWIYQYEHGPRPKEDEHAPPASH